MKIAHFFPDEIKFFPGALLYFKKLREHQDWYIRTSTKNIQQYQDRYPEGNITLYEGNDYSRFRDYDGLIIHYLDHEMAKLVLSLPKTSKFYIQTWGGDLELLFSARVLYGDKTISYIISKSKARFFPYPLSLYAYEFARQRGHQKWSKAIKQAMANATYCSFGLGEIEREFFTDSRTSNSEHVINYYPHQTQNSESAGKETKFLLGNSSTPTNQHLEALLAIKKSRVDVEQIVIPLSYGNMNYATWIENKAKSIFGRKVFIIQDFMNLTDYNKLISSCGVVIMNHVRQQALGNIFHALISGKQVALNPRGLTFQFLQSKGIPIHTTRQLELVQTDPFSPRDIIQPSRKVWDERFNIPEEKSSAFFRSLFS